MVVGRTAITKVTLASNQGPFQLVRIIVAQSGRPRVQFKIAAESVRKCKEGSAPGEPLTVSLQVTPHIIGHTKELVIFDFGVIKIVREFSITAAPVDRTPNPSNMHKAINSMQIVQQALYSKEDDRQGCPEHQSRSARLQQFAIPTKMWEIVSNARLIQEFVSKYSEEPLNERNYCVRQLSISFLRICSDKKLVSRKYFKSVFISMKLTRSWKI